MIETQERDEAILGNPGMVEKPDQLVVSLQSGGQELIQAHAEAWRDLCDRAEPENALLRPGLVGAYFDAFAPDTSLILLTAYRGDRLVGLLPLHEKSAGAGPFRIRWLRTAGNAPLHRRDALYADEDLEAVAGAFWRVIRDAYPGYMFYTEMTAADGVIARMREMANDGGRVARSFYSDGSPRVPVPAPDMDIEAVIAAQNKRVRRLVRSGLRRLEDRGTLRFVHVQDEAEGKDLAEWLGLFCDLEDRGWKGGIATSIKSLAGMSAFYQSVVHDEELRPYFGCMALMLDDVMFAGDIGFFAGDTYFSEKLAMNEDYKDCSPGHLLHLYLLMECARHGIKTLDLGGQAEPYKLFWTDVTNQYGSVFIFPEGMRGHLLKRILLDVAIPGREYLRTKNAARRIGRVLRQLRSRKSGGPSDQQRH